jgi:Cytochrome P450
VADVDHVRYELITFLIASRDTVSAHDFFFAMSSAENYLLLQTSSLLTFVIYLLALYPDVCHRLREEVVNTFGLTGTPSYEHLKDMDYRAFSAHILCILVSIA